MTVLEAPPPNPPAPPAPPAPAPRRPEGTALARRRPSDLTPQDAVTAAASAASALAFTWVVYARLTAGVGWFAFLLTAYAVFLVLFGLVTRDRLGPLVARDRMATTVVYSGALLLLAPLVLLVGYVVYRGLPALRPSFFVNDLGGVAATAAATDGGGAHAIVGTLQQVGLALVVTVPLSLACAVFLNETRSRFRRPVRIVVDAMSGLPSVVCGLFIFAVLIIPLGRQLSLFNYNGLMASLALSMVMVPTITRTVEVVLRLVPDGLREAGLALGASKARTVWSVVLPTARSGLTTAVVLGIARAVGETAPLLFTAFGNDLMNANPFSGPQDSLPLFVYKSVRKPSEASIDRGFAGALVLMLVVLALFVLARFVGRDRSATARRPNRRRLRLPRPGVRVRAVPPPAPDGGGGGGGRTVPPPAPEPVPSGGGAIDLRSDADPAAWQPAAPVPSAVRLFDAPGALGAADPLGPAIADFDDESDLGPDEKVGESHLRRRARPTTKKGFPTP